MIAAFASKFVLYHILKVWDPNGFPAYSILGSRLPLMLDFVSCGSFFYGVNGLAFLCYGNTVEMGSTLQTLRMFLEHKYNLPFVRECTGINIEHQNATKFVPTVS